MDSAGNIPLEIDPKLNAAELTKVAKEISKGLSDIVKIDSNGIPFLEKGRIQALQIRNSIHKIQTAVSDVAKIKTPTAQYTELKNKIKDIKAELEKVNKENEKQEKKVKVASARVSELNKALKAEKGTVHLTKEFSDWNTELTKNEKQLAKVMERISKMQALGTNIYKSGKNVGKVTTTYKSALYDASLLAKKNEEITATLNRLTEEGKKFEYGDPEKINKLQDDLKKARSESRAFHKELRQGETAGAGLQSQLENATVEVTKLEETGKAFTIGDDVKTDNLLRQLEVATERGKALINKTSAEMAKAVNSGISDVANGASEMVNAGLAKVPSSFEKIKADAKTMADAIKGTRTFEVLTAPAKKAGEVVKGVTDKIKEAWKTSAIGHFTNEMAKSVKQDFNTIKVVAVGALKAIPDAASNAMNKVKEKVKNSTIGKDISKVFDAFKTTNIGKSFSKIPMASSKAFSKVKGHASSAKKSLDKFKPSINKISGAFKAIGKAANVFKSIKNKAKNAFQSLTKHSESSKKHLLRSFIQYGLGFRSLFFLARRLRATLKEALEGIASDIPSFNTTLSSLSNTFTQLKGSIGTAVQPLVTALAPVLERIMGLAINAANAIATFFATLTGQSVIYTAAKGNANFADSANDAAKATKKQKKAQEDLNQVLGEYDKLSVIGQDKNKDTGDSGSGGAEATTPAFTTTAIDPKNAVSDFAAKLKAAWEAQDFKEIGTLVGNKFNEVVAKIDEAIKWENVGPKITKWINNFADAFNAFMTAVDWTNVGNTITDGLNTIVYSVETFLDAIDWGLIGTSMSETVNGLITTFDLSAVGRTLAKGINSITSLINNFVYKTDWGALGTNLSQSVLSFLNELNPAELGKTLAAPFVVLTDTLNGFLTDFTSGGGFAKLGETMGATISSWFTSIDFAKIGQNIKLGIDGIITTLRTMFSSVDWSSIGADFAEIINGIFNVDWGSVGTLLSDIVHSALDLLISLIEKTDWVQLGRSVIDLIMGIDWVGLVQKLISTFDSLLFAAVDIVAGLIEELDLTKLIGILIGVMTAMFQPARLKKYASKMATAAGHLVGALVSCIVNSAISLGKFVSNLIKKLKESIAKKKADWKKSGKSVWQGVLDGIVNAIKNIGSWIKKNIWDKFIKGFKDTFGIHSPSKKMKKFGGYIIDGLKSGLGNIWGKVKEKFTDCLNKIKDWASGLWGKITGWFKGSKEGKEDDMSVEVQNKTDESKVGKWWSNIKGWFGKKRDNDGEGLTTEVKNKTTKADAGKWWTDVKNWFTEKKGDDKLSASAEVNVSEKEKSNGKKGTEIIKGRLKDIDKTEAKPNVDVKDKNNSISGMDTKISNLVKDRTVKVTDALVTKAAQDALSKQLAMEVLVAGATVGVTAIPVSKFGARGGIIDRPTALLAGEDGPEALIPLKNHTQWLDQVGKYVVSHLTLGNVQIPKLAQGKVIPPNKEFLAMLGDQKSGTNVETPLSVIEQALENVFSKYMGQGQAPIYIQLNGRTIAEAVNAENRKRERQFV